MTDTPLPTLLKRHFGYDTFRPMQQDIITHIIGGGDALVLMPTGGGKSLCYQLPALALDGTAIVVSPLISLMKDQVDSLRACGIAATALNSAATDAELATQRQRLAQGQVRIVYMSPERLLADTPWLQQHLHVSLIAIDEAHCISQWGHDFRPEYTRLDTLHHDFPGTPLLALTATADKITQNDIIAQLRLNHTHRVFTGSFDRPNLSLEVLRGYNAHDRLRAILAVIARHPQQSGIIYCLARKTATTLSQQLQEHGINARAYHAGLSNDERSQVQDLFSNDRISVVCATIAFGMGIDKSNIRFVLHYNLPKSIESYYQEIGRGGRDSLPTETILFFNLQDLITLRKFANDSGQADINLQRLNRITEYAEARVCRRRILLNYFGQNTSTNCGNCDICKAPPEYFDGTVIAQKALSAIKRTDEKASMPLTIDILRGNLTDTVRAHDYQHLKTFGAGHDIPYRIWHDYMLQMLQLGFFEIDYKNDNHLLITPLGDDILHSRARASLATVSLEQFKTKTAKAKPASKALLFQDDDEDPTLFELLRQLRRDIADATRRPAFTVLSDKSLHDMAAKRPVTLPDFATVYGIGDHKLKTLGPRFTQAIAQYLKARNHPQPPEQP